MGTALIRQSIIAIAVRNCSGVNAGSRCREGKVCSDGICGITCVSSQIVCNGQCIDPNTDNRYCGASGSCSGTNSGNKCVSGQVCSNGKCGITCVSSQIVCGGQCIDPETDNRYCGAKGSCNNADSSNSDYKGEMCTDGRVCINGICTLNCPSRLLKCGSACIDPNTNGTYCGAKGACNNYDISSADFYGFYCGHNHVCLNGACVLNSCDAPLVLCSTTTGNQCIDINETDENNCGACGYKCAEHPIANAEATRCLDGRCIYECKTGYANKGTGDTASEILCVDSAL